jgi:hypothetical protein
MRYKIKAEGTANKFFKNMAESHILEMTEAEVARGMKLTAG